MEETEKKVRINLQIQHFEEDYKIRYKEWCAEHNLSMRLLLEKLIDNKEVINQVLKQGE